MSTCSAPIRHPTPPTHELGSRHERLTQARVAAAVAVCIARLRHQAGLTQRELAERAHVNRDCIASWEQGRSIPKIDTLAVVGEALPSGAEGLLLAVGFELADPDVSTLPRVVQVAALDRARARLGRASEELRHKLVELAERATEARSGAQTRLFGGGAR